MALTAIEQVRALQIPDVDVLAATLWAEGRNQNILGRIAIGCVVRNRMARRQQSVTQVCLAPLQFSCWWPAGGVANYQALQMLLSSLDTVIDPVWKECQWIASGILDGRCLDVTSGADHYLTTRLLASDQRPRWASTMTCTGVVGDHTFYRS